VESLGIIELKAVVQKHEEFILNQANELQQLKKTA